MTGLGAASCGLGWSNYNPRSLGAQGFLGRNAPGYCTDYATSNRYDSCHPRAVSQSASGVKEEVPPECRQKCDWDTVAPSVEQLVLCAICLALVSVTRVLLQMFLVKFLHQHEPLESLAFPMWEGPVFLTQFIGITEALCGLLGSGCVWIVVVSALLVCAGPVAFVIYAGYALHARRADGSLAYERAPWPSCAELRERWSSAKWFGKYYAVQDYLTGLKCRGEWGADSSAGRHWSFIVGDFTKFAYLYCIWLLVKKLLLTATMQHIDGGANAVIALSLQGIDTVLLVLLLPFNDMQTTAIEAVAGIIAAIAYLSIAVPILDIQLPELDLPYYVKFLLASTGAILAGVCSALESATRLLRALLICSGALALPAIIIPEHVAIDVLTGTGAGAIVAGNVADDLIARARAYAEGEEEEKDAVDGYEDALGKHTSDSDSHLSQCKVGVCEPGEGEFSAGGEAFGPNSEHEEGNGGLDLWCPLLGLMPSFDAPILRRRRQWHSLPR